MCKVWPQCVFVRVREVSGGNRQSCGWGRKEASMKQAGEGLVDLHASHVQLVIELSGLMSNNSLDLQNIRTRSVLNGVLWGNEL